MKRTAIGAIVAAAALAVTTACGSREAEKAAQEAAAGAQQAAQGAQQAAQGAQQAAQGAQQAAQGVQQAAGAAQGATQQGAQQFTQGMQQLAQGLQQMQAAQGDVVKFEDLQTLLPEQLGGWTRKNVRGEQVSMPFKVSHAQARYELGSSSLDVDVTDALLNQLLITPLSMFMVTGFEERSSDGYTKYAALSGSPGFVKWEQGPKRAEVTVIVNKRFVVQAVGRNVSGVEPVQAAVQGMDLARLGGLK